MLKHRIVGERHLKLTLGLPGVSGIIDAIHFNVPVETLPSASAGCVAFTGWK